MSGFTSKQEEEEEEERAVKEKAQAAAAAKIAQRYPGLFQMPFINEYTKDIGALATFIAEKNPQDFNWAISFSPEFIAQLMYHGFLTMCERLRKDSYLLMPKLHKVRSVLMLKNLHIGKSCRKKSKRFSFSVDSCFDNVCAGIVEQHGENWFHPPLVAAFKEMHARGRVHHVTMHSFEIWDNESGQLVAGEAGYAVGAVYTSMSGFSKMDSAGSVQMAALGALLVRCGFGMWDLGMDIDYKSSLGAKPVPRPAFLGGLKMLRDKPTTLLDLRQFVLPNKDWTTAVRIPASCLVKSL